MTHAQPPKLTPRQYVGAAITLVLGVVWLAYELRGEVVPAGLGQGLVLSLALVAGSASVDRPGGSNHL